MRNPVKSRALIVSCAVVALVAVSVAEIPRPRRPLRGAERCAAVDCAEGINTSAEGGIVINYSSDETSIP